MKPAAERQARRSGLSRLRVGRTAAAHSHGFALADHAPWGWALAGALVGLLVTTVAFAPARWAAAALHTATEGRIQLLDARGSVWTGSARLVLTGGAGSQDTQALPTRVAWRLRPQATGPDGGLPGLSLQLQSDCCTPTPLALALAWRPGQVALHLADTPASQWPAGLLAGLGTPWNTLDLEGQLRLHTQGLRLGWAAGRLQVQGQADLALVNASSRLATLRPLGSYRLQLQGGDTPALRLDTLDGDLRIQGQGQWVGARLRFTGDAQAAPGREATLDNLLNIIGRRAGPRALITLG